MRHITLIDETTPTALPGRHVCGECGGEEIEFLAHVDPNRRALTWVADDASNVYCHTCREWGGGAYATAEVDDLDALRAAYDTCGLYYAAGTRARDVARRLGVSTAEARRRLDALLPSGAVSWHALGRLRVYRVHEAGRRALGVVS